MCKGQEHAIVPPADHEAYSEHVKHHDSGA